jgi:hypothetical protein
MDVREGVIRDPASLHKYLYAGADPVSYIDPNGEFKLPNFTIAGVVRTALYKAQSISLAFAIWQCRFRVMLVKAESFLKIAYMHIYYAIGSSAFWVANKATLLANKSIVIAMHAIEIATQA